ncbi:MAG: hypothetical protein NTW13_06110 [Candidatus Omnitrophica bacterium]|nr:hypothetical protein [Candidatus Omnitrophota bacterium]
MEIKKIKLPFKIKGPILALGPQLKNTICFAKDNLAYLSRIHSDLSNLPDFLNFEKDLKYFLKNKPRAIAYDLHPEYASTKYASAHLFGYSPVAVQHHHAHIASCMVENGLKNQKVIGVAFDGTGLGSDDTIWGAEFLVCDYKNFLRKAHLKEIPLLGGAQAILEPWRLAAAWLNFPGEIDKKQLLRKIYKSGINSPLASSMGRLFDAVGSLVLNKKIAGFEAELAIELEKIATGYKLQAIGYPFAIIKREDKYILDPGKMFKVIVRDIKRKKPKARIAFCFHLTVAKMIKKTCLILRKETNINKVILSGGVFQNKLLLKLALDLLYREGFKVFTQKKISCNDSGISLGQAVIAGIKG